jgi:signal transduction histidine kinase
LNRFTFREKLVASHFGLVLVAFFLVAILLERSLAADLEAERDQRLLEQARGAGDWVSSTRHPNRVAGRLAQVVQSEVVIFDRDNCIVGSSVPDADPLTEGTPCVAPEEVIDARALGRGSVERMRAGDRMHYVAIPSADGLVVRLARSSRDIEGPLGEMRLRLAIAMVVALVLALGLALLASRLVARPLRAMALEASRIAQGDYEPHFPSLPKDEFGQLAGVLSALAQTLKADLERISKLELTRRDFVANVTHELRTPVAAIQGCAETLMNGALDREQQLHFVQLLHKHAQRIHALVEGLLQLSKIEAEPRADVPREPLDVYVVAANVLETMSAKAAARGVKLENAVPPGLQIFGDETRLEQVFENLVENAIKYGRDKGVIRLTAEADEKRVVIAISDDGPGIEAVHLPRVFERFYRIDSGRSRDRGGAGLGLAIVKHLVESMGGAIAVTSDHGATFTLTFPREPGGPASRRAIAS